MPTWTLAMDRLLNRARPAWPARRRQPARWDYKYGHDGAWAQHGIGMGVDMGWEWAWAYVQYSQSVPIPIHPGINHNHKMTAFKQRSPVPATLAAERLPEG